MDGLIALLLTLACLIWFKTIRRDKVARPVNIGSASAHPAMPGHTSSENVDYLTRLEALPCIYLDRSVIHKARVVQAEALEGEAHIVLQLLKTDGFDQSPDDVINLNAPLNTMDHTSTVLHAPYANWQLFVDKQLIEEVSELARRGEDPTAVRKVLHQHRMKVSV